MLQLWRKPHTMVISPEGVILNSGSKISRLVDMQLSLSNKPALWTQVLTEFEENPISVAVTSPIRVIISNHYVRYAVLPWQTGIYSQQDWQSLAENHLRSVYGNVVDGWKISVAMQGYGKPLLISAIDHTLLARLQDMASQYHWTIDVIEPALFSVVNHYRHKIKKEAWLMMVEPQRSVLAEIINDVIVQFTVAFPPESQEKTASVNLVKRALKSQHKTDSVLIAIFGESQLLVDFNMENITLAPLSANKNTENTLTMGLMLSELT